MLSAAELCLVASEIQETCGGARLQKIAQPADDRIVLRFSSDSGDHALLVVAGRPYPRAHFVETAPPNPRTPPPFCDQLRACLMPARLTSARTSPGDRVLSLEFEVRTESGAVTRQLIAELFGGRPNILVVDHDRTILYVMEPSTGGARELVAGARYAEAHRPSKDLAPPPPFLWLPQREESVSLSSALEAWFAPREAEEKLAERRQRLEQSLRQSQKKNARLVENLRRDVSAGEGVPLLMAEGELLKASLSRMKRGMKEIAVTDWSSGEGVERRIALDPALTPHEEVSGRFEEARRIEKTARASATRLAAVEERAALLERLIANASSALSEESLSEIEREAAPFLPKDRQGSTKAPAQKIEPRKPYMTFTSLDGIEMLVGRTARENDELTFDVANGNDFWFHVRDWPGSHVVIRAREDLPQETMLDAATLAVHFSKAEFAGKRDVSWTRRKFVSKGRGSPAGQVMLSAHKTIHLRAEPERLARLLRRNTV